MAYATIRLSAEDSFYVYHSICEYLAGDYGKPISGILEQRALRTAIQKFGMEARNVELTKPEARSLLHAYSRVVYADNVPVDNYAQKHILNTLGQQIPEPDEGRVSAGETKHYGEEWPQKRQEILSRDGGECRNCGTSNETHKSRYNVGLHIHHITPLSHFATPGDANQDGNLISLCMPCHAKLEDSPDRCRSLLPEGASVS